MVIKILRPVKGRRRFVERITAVAVLVQQRIVAVTCIIDFLRLAVVVVEEQTIQPARTIGLHSSLKIYSGGLGILAGDYLKEASDKNVPMAAVGLLYRYGYFTQQLSSQGSQVATYEAFSNFLEAYLA